MAHFTNHETSYQSHNAVSGDDRVSLTEVAPVSISSNNYSHSAENPDRPSGYYVDGAGGRTTIYRHACEGTGRNRRMRSLSTPRQVVQASLFLAHHKLSMRVGNRICGSPWRRMKKSRTIVALSRAQHLPGLFSTALSSYTLTSSIACFHFSTRDTLINVEESEFFCSQPRRLEQRTEARLSLDSVVRSCTTAFARPWICLILLSIRRIPLRSASPRY
jgi:hypothetical protein